MLDMPWIAVRPPGSGGDGTSPRRPYVGNFVLLSDFEGSDSLLWRILRRNDAQKHGFIRIKK